MNRASTGDPIPDAQLSTDVLIVGGGPIGLALALHLDMLARAAISARRP